MASAALPPAGARSVLSRGADLILPIGFIASVLVIMVPMPPELLDVLLALNISVAVIMLLTTIYVRTPLEFSIFPSLLLATTLGRLVLNVDPDSNVGEEGQELGVCPWRCLARLAVEDDEKCRYADILLTAPSLRRAEEMVVEATDKLLPKDVADWDEATIINADRLRPEDFATILAERSQKPPQKPQEERIIWCEWLE